MTTQPEIPSWYRYCECGHRIVYHMSDHCRGANSPKCECKEYVEDAEITRQKNNRADQPESFAMELSRLSIEKREAMLADQPAESERKANYCNHPNRTELCLDCGYSYAGNATWQPASTTALEVEGQVMAVALGAILDEVTNNGYVSVDAEESAHSALKAWTKVLNRQPEPVRCAGCGLPDGTAHFGATHTFEPANTDALEALRIIENQEKIYRKVAQDPVMNGLHYNGHANGLEHAAQIIRQALTKQPEPVRLHEGNHNWYTVDETTYCLTCFSKGYIVAPEPASTEPVRLQPITVAGCTYCKVAKGFPHQPDCDRPQFEPASTEGEIANDD